MIVFRSRACMKNLARLSNLVNRKEGLAFGSSFRRRASVESGRSEGFAEELSNGKQFAALWGNGDFGRLGLGNLESQWRPKPIFPSAFDDQSLQEVACGGAHTLFLTETGDVYATGLNDFGQLGISDSQNYTTEPHRVSRIPKKIIKIAAGYHHSAAITVDGELYVWGKNANGQLGLGKKAEKIIPLPRKVECLDGVAIKMVSLGFEHSIAVTDNGEALSWGGGESGRLGHGHESSILGFQKSGSEYTPRLIKGFEGVKVKSVSAGMMHSACICENGSVYFFGERELGKWGFGKAKSVTTPAAISALPFSEEVACGGYHTCVISTDGGELYTWGSNENGCLGIGGTDINDSPERVEGPFSRQPVSKVSCGWKHTAAISGGDVYTWGWGGSNGTFKEDGHSPGGQLGQGDDIDYTEPMLLDFNKSLKALQISCGFNHTAAIFQCI
ncbi:ultraviolet-B receptor UVR8 isoform X2 [Sesamum indicum]|uniref:Ultraviolet-B receptor UVR8 isoform X2 n=1 Tax=Sesamum indicum TaxID=4182 RepID=A0A6I9UQS6_SESIN|nr:ultraviolet-B receptor UVR8 isoform X2 [Sesamum indicum]